MAIYYPPVFINEYLKEQVASAFGDTTNLPFFPTSPTAIDDLTQTFQTGTGLGMVYDRMLKMRRGPFPHIKYEQLLYYLYGTAENAISQVIEVTQLVSDLLDNGDESAQDLNSWIRAKQQSASPLVDDSGTPFPEVYFHEIKIYQLEETRDIIDFGTARTYAGNKIIIDYSWHKS